MWNTTQTNCWVLWLSKVSQNWDSEMWFCKREDYDAPGISQTDITERKTFWKRGHRETSKKSRTVWSDKRKRAHSERMKLVWVQSVLFHLVQLGIYMKIIIKELPSPRAFRYVRSRSKSCSQGSRKFSRATPICKQIKHFFKYNFTHCIEPKIP